MHGLQNMQRAMLNQSLPQQGMPDADYIWGGDHIGYSGMGSYGDLPGSGQMCVWDPVESEGMGLSRSKSASRTATEDEQRKREVDELARDIDALNKKITAASMSREHIIAEWAMIAYEATHLVDRQLALINVLKCTIHQVGEEAQTLVETYHMCVDDSDEDDMAMPMRSDLQDKYDMKYEWNHSAMMNSLGHSNSYHLDSFTSLSKDSLMPGIGSLGSIGSLGPSKASTFPLHVCAMANSPTVPVWSSPAWPRSWSHSLCPHRSYRSNPGHDIVPCAEAQIVRYE